MCPIATSLCQLASKATRKLHKPNTRLQDTTNEVLGRFQTTNPGSAASVEARGAAGRNPPRRLIAPPEGYS
jgi:hypothetical protein